MLKAPEEYAPGWGKKIFRYRYMFKDGPGQYRVFFKNWHVEISLFKSFCGVKFETKSEHGTLFVGIPPVAIWLSIDTFRMRNYKFDDARAIGFNIYDWSIHWKLWTPSMSWSSKTPRWRDGSWHPLDTFLGRKVHREIRIVEEATVDVPMPEGVYPAKIAIKEEEWKRRWWFPERIKRCHADMLVPIPHPGKGENSWDCGDDGTYGMTCLANTIVEAVGKIVESSLHDRVRRGGYGNWKWKSYQTLEEYEKKMAKIKSRQAKEAPSGQEI